ncbi:MAG: hypothetical protein KatS3mg008_0627 [Acidimicrobiales bacterium]|nr:MAG: hypothetical protein KatS3mg008_0627 [Acidimicrobiales bacterium]
MVHPIEHLRALALEARPQWVTPDELLSEAADALARLPRDSGELVVACRRLLDRCWFSGDLWWLCALLVGSTEVDVRDRVGKSLAEMQRAVSAASRRLSGGGASASGQLTVHRAWMAAEKSVVLSSEAATAVRRATSEGREVLVATTEGCWVPEEVWSSVAARLVDTRRTDLSLELVRLGGLVETVGRRSRWSVPPALLRRGIVPGTDGGDS